jgi:hypothetical protein
VLYCPVQTFAVVLTLSPDTLSRLTIKSYILAKVSSGNIANFVEGVGFSLKGVAIAPISSA